MRQHRAAARAPAVLFYAFAFALAAALLLSGCTGKPEWTKQNTTAEQVERDKAKCTREFLGGSRTAGGAFRQKDVDSACMKKLGYARQ